MTVPVGRTYFSPDHAENDVTVLDDILVFDRRSETRPTAPTVELLERREQWFSRYHVHVDARVVEVPIFVVEGRLSLTFLGDLVLAWRSVGKGPPGSRGNSLTFLLLYVVCSTVSHIAVALQVDHRGLSR